MAMPANRLIWLTPELSDCRPAVITLVTLGNQGAWPKSVTVELRTGSSVRSSDLVGRSIFTSLGAK